MKKALLVLAVILTLPVLLFIYQPSIQLGAIGFLAGVVGMTLTPLIIFFSLGYMVKKEWNKGSKPAEKAPQEPIK